MMQAGMMAALVVSGVAGVGMMGNEMSHGGMSEMLGMGHNHMADYGGYHCASHTDEHGSHHMEHMHNGTFSNHDHCTGGSAMHGHPGTGSSGGMTSHG